MTEFQRVTLKAKEFMIEQGYPSVSDKWASSLALFAIKYAKMKVRKLERAKQKAEQKKASDPNSIHTIPGMRHHGLW